MGFSTLLSRAKGGDEAALEALFLTVYPMLHAEITRGLPVDLERFTGIEDILQDVYLEATLRLGTFEDRGEPAFEAWMRTIAKHRLINVITAQRSGKRAGPTGRIPLLDDADAFGDEALRRPISAVGALEDRSMIIRLLDCLKSGQREILRLRYLRGMGPREIGLLLGRTPEAVGMATLRALRALRDEIGRRGSRQG